MPGSNADTSQSNTHADELLAVRCQLGEADAFDLLIDRWHAPLWSYIRRMSSDDEEAADLHQEAWLRVLRALPRLREPARLRPWLFGIARRVVMDRLRVRYATPPHESIDVADVDYTAAEAAPDLAEANAGELQAMHRELGAMPLIEREVLVLFYLHELTLAQVADVLAVPEGTVKSRLHRARGMLRQRLTREETD